MTKYWCNHCGKIIAHTDYRKNNPCPFCSAGFMDIFSIKKTKIILPKKIKHGDSFNPFQESKK